MESPVPALMPKPSGLVDQKPGRIALIQKADVDNQDAQLNYASEVLGPSPAQTWLNNESCPDDWPKDRTYDNRHRVACDGDATLGRWEQILGNSLAWTITDRQEE